RSVEYTFYGADDPNGPEGGLKLVTVKDAAGNAIDTSYYRYYTADGPTGYAGALKYVFNPDSFGRLTGALGIGVDSLTDAQVAPYADNYFEYDALHRVTKEVAQGSGCSACTGGLGTYTYAYTVSGNADGANSWKVKTTETLPDGNQNVVYTNADGL